MIRSTQQTLWSLLTLFNGVVVPFFKLGTYTDHQQGWTGHPAYRIQGGGPATKCWPTDQAARWRSSNPSWPGTLVLLLLVMEILLNCYQSGLSPIGQICLGIPYQWQLPVTTKFQGFLKGTKISLPWSGGKVSVKGGAVSVNVFLFVKPHKLLYVFKG